MTMNDTPQTIKHINVRVVEESPVPWEELFGYMPEITDGLPVADYEALTDAEDALKHARAVLLDEATARVRAES